MTAPTTHHAPTSTATARRPPRLSSRLHARNLTCLLLVLFLALLPAVAPGVPLPSPIPSTRRSCPSPAAQRTSFRALAGVVGALGALVAVCAAWRAEQLVLAVRLLAVCTLLVAVAFVSLLGILPSLCGRVWVAPQPPAVAALAIGALLAGAGLLSSFGCCKPPRRGEGK